MITPDEARALSNERRDDNIKNIKKEHVAKLDKMIREACEDGDFSADLEWVDEGYVSDVYKYLSALGYKVDEHNQEVLW